MGRKISLIDFLGHQDLSNHSLDISIQAILDSVRNQLDISVAFASQFVSANRIFLFVSSEGQNGSAEISDSDEIMENFFHYIERGHFSKILDDATASQFLGGSGDIDYGSAAHIGVPLVFSDGRVFGSICCFSERPDLNYNEKDLFLVQVAARIISELMERHLEQLIMKDQARDRIKQAIEFGEFEIVYQPIVDLDTRRLDGLEALARFPDNLQRPPTAWFEEASDVGLEVDLDLALIRRAIEILPQLRETTYVSLNVSANTVLSGRLPETLQHTDCNRLVIELSEHHAVDDYRLLNKCLKKISGDWKLAVDDVGAGYSSMRHILDVGPDIMKLDISFVRDIDRRPSRAALVKAIMTFADSSNTLLIAEGIESEDEWKELQRLGVKYGQGYYFAKPMKRSKAISLGPHV